MVKPFAKVVYFKFEIEYTQIIENIFNIKIGYFIGVIEKIKIILFFINNETWYSGLLFFCSLLTVRPDTEAFFSFLVYLMGVKDILSKVTNFCTNKRWPWVLPKQCHCWNISKFPGLYYHQWIFHLYVVVSQIFLFLNYNYYHHLYLCLPFA